jgi:site-specific DNA-methyltransferase (adenine-specific)
MKEKNLTENLNWISTTIKIKDLAEFPSNPRKMSQKDFNRLVRDIKQDGYHKRIIIDNTNTILGGHSRIQALLAAGYDKSDEIEVLKASRPLSKTERSRINIRDNLAFGEFDTDILANEFDPIELIDWGMTVHELGLSEDEPIADKEAKELNKTKTCPNCGHEY